MTCQLRKRHTAAYFVESPREADTTL